MLHVTGAICTWASSWGDPRSRDRDPGLAMLKPEWVGWMQMGQMIAGTITITVPSSYSLLRCIRRSTIMLYHLEKLFLRLIYVGLSRDGVAPLRLSSLADNRHNLAVVMLCYGVITGSWSRRCWCYRAVTPAIVRAVAFGPSNLRHRQQVNATQLPHISTIICHWCICSGRALPGMPSV